MAAGRKPVTCRNLRTKVFDEIQKKELASGSSKVNTTSKIGELSKKLADFTYYTNMQ